jgi:membrane-associated phospholipid phosphatase
MGTEISLVLFMQSLAHALTPLMHVFSFLGSETFYLLVPPALLWCFDAALGLQVGMLLMTSANLNSTAKMLFGTPRPYWVDPNVRALAAEPTYGFPSGHAQNSAVLWGMLACAAQRPWVTLVGLALILCVSLSRLALGVHSATDILGGWLIGAVLLFGFLKFGAAVGAWARSGSLTSRLLAALGASLGLLALGVVVGRWLAQPPLAEWVTRAALASPNSSPIQPLDLSYTFSTAGSWFGLAAGGILLLRWGRFRADGPWEQRVGRYALGTAGLLALYLGLRALLPHGEDALGFAMRFVRYAALGFWIAYAAPWLFVNLGLSGGAPAEAT